jgi:hypothetical protein
MSNEIITETTRYKTPAKSEVALSEALISVENHPSYPGYHKVLIPDLAKANLQRRELNAVRVNAVAANFIALAGTEMGLDLRPSQKYVIDNMVFFTNSSRTKDGWAGFLAKTNKSISEEKLEQRAEQISASAPEQKSLKQKLLRQ